MRLGALSCCGSVVVIPPWCIREAISLEPNLTQSNIEGGEPITSGGLPQRIYFVSGGTRTVRWCRIGGGWRRCIWRNVGSEKELIVCFFRRMSDRTNEERSGGAGVDRRVESRRPCALSTRPAKVRGKCRARATRLTAIAGACEAPRGCRRTS